MKKILLLCLLLLCGCSNNQDEIVVNNEPTLKDLFIDKGMALSTIKNVECYKYEGFNIPIYFGMASDNIKEIINCNEEDAYKLIKTYPDVLSYLLNKDFLGDPSQYTQMAANLLVNKYDEVGTIDIYCKNNFYSLIYIKEDGIYYVDNIFSRFNGSNLDYMDGFNIDDCAFTSMDELKNSISKGFTFMDEDDYVLRVDNLDYNYEAIKADNNIEYKVVESHNEKCILYNDYALPVVFGLPQLTRDQIDSLPLDFDSMNFGGETYKTINTYADALSFLTRLNSKDDPFYYVDNVCNLLANKYDEVGSLTIVCNKQRFIVFYIKKNGKYYTDSTFDRIKKFSNTWMNGFNNDYFTFDSKEDMKEIIADSFMGIGEDDSVVSVLDKSYNFETIKDDNGNEYIYEERLKEKVYKYCNYQIPIGLGFPKLSKDEIKQLVNSSDKSSVASRINTLADAICYMQEARFECDPIGSKTCNNINITDVGNIYYQNDNLQMAYAVPGLEQLYIRKGQCTSTSTLLAYLLEDDYKQIGYIYLSYEEGGHCMIYIKGNDDRYYLINPASYLIENKYNDSLWLPFYSYEKGCASSLKELMDELINSDNAGGPNSKPTMLFTADAIGVVCHGANIDGDEKNAGTNIISSIKYFPRGSNPVCWTNNSQYQEVDINYSDSQTLITGIKDIY